MTDEEFDAPAAIECHPCPTCDVPAGSACRTGAGKTAVKYHTRRLQLVPRVAEELHVLTPPDRGPGKRWVLGPEPGGAEPAESAESAPLAAGITSVRIGYARCSTATQELQSQLDALEPVCFEVFHEKVSTRVKVWPEYEKAVAMARGFKRLHSTVQVILTVHEFRRLGRGTDLLVTVEDLRKAGIALEFLSGPITGLYDPGDRHGQGAILFGVLAALSGAERTYTREKTLEGQESARRRGRTGGRPPSLDADQIEYALTLRAKGTPMKEIQQKTVITRGKHKGKHPSLPTLYRTLAEAAAQRTDT
ncbi:recombinase family protein [Streptomyces sp. NPDC014744]|uniref:recombinase family protein n=1 Tax=Streptomyces sp. NPDC014744 TaxID=3364903 RepID=UPI003702A6E0